LLERHPRASWPAEASASAGFWLEVHEHLRRDCAGLEAAADDRRSSRTSAAQLAAIAAPRLRGLVAAMIGHHQIEDFHYFPAFRRDEPRLAAGFDRLESDHATLARDVDAAQRALADLVAAAETPALRVATDRYVAAAQGLCARLREHLADEEDLVVPLLIERRER
jgi:hypothetical protein